MREDQRNPVYLWIDNGEAQLMDTPHLWGRDSFETYGMIKEELGDGHLHFYSPLDNMDESIKILIYLRVT